ncbi:MHYT domain-containing protein [Streptomyces sp. NPDC006879]|uniref:MHYT domain-containing protein n=1 Tax=Streptomyces sp. NPDC006879 TaxID=3364767 RepID=UPI0036A934EF
MYGTIGWSGAAGGFGQALVPHLAAFLVACLGGALGLGCATRPRRAGRGYGQVWQFLGATAIASGVWTMHFIATRGDPSGGASPGSDALVVSVGLTVALLMITIGLAIAGHPDGSTLALLTGGTIIGLGIASLHFLGISHGTPPGRLSYHIPLVAVAVLFAVAAATAAQWAIRFRSRGPVPAFAAALLMGLAGSGMHHIAMGALDVPPGTPQAGAPTAGQAGSGLPLAQVGGLAVLLLVAAILSLRGPRRRPRRMPPPVLPRLGPPHRSAPAPHRPAPRQLHGAGARWHDGRVRP